MTPIERRLAGKLGLWRFAIGRTLIHAGLAIMPRSRARSELYQLFELWGTQVRASIRVAKEG